MIPNLLNECQVYHVWHFCAKFDDDLEYSSDKDEGQHPHFIGLFSSRERAEAAVAYCRNLPGFVEWSDSFKILYGKLESDGWESGFATYYYDKDDHE